MKKKRVLETRQLRPAMKRHAVKRKNECDLRNSAKLVERIMREVRPMVAAAVA